MPVKVRIYHGQAVKKDREDEFLSLSQLITKYELKKQKLEVFINCFAFKTCKKSVQERWLSTHNRVSAKLQRLKLQRLQ